MPPEEGLQAEYIRNLAHPMLLLRLQSDKLNNRIPQQLRLPSQENERSSDNIVNTIQNFLLIRHLVCKLLLKQSRKKQLEDSLATLDIEFGIAKNWHVNDVISPLPQNTGYQNCLLKTKQKHEIQQLVMMGDPVFLVLLKADFTNA